MPAPASHFCFCGRGYSKLKDLEEHRTAQRHLISHQCTDLCYHPPPPADDGRTHICKTCNKKCARLEILNDHQIARGHCYYCAECELKFDNERCLKDHRKKVSHASEFKCCDCDMSFKDIQDLLFHVESSEYHKPLKKEGAGETTSNRRCEKCSRKFKTPGALQDHLASLKHNPISNLRCPIGNDCRRKYKSPSALLHHLESGGCSSGLTRDEIYKMVQKCDTNHVIHDKPQIATSASSFSSTPIHTPPPSIGSWAIPSDTGSDWSFPLSTPTTSEYGETEQWTPLENSQMTIRSGIQVTPATLQCHLCPPTRKPFATTTSLRQHMASAAHSTKLYHCPTTFVLGPNTKQAQGKAANKPNKHTQKQFSTLSGLTQHLESGACVGGKTKFLQYYPRALEHVWTSRGM